MMYWMGEVAALQCCWICSDSGLI